MQLTKITCEDFDGPHPNPHHVKGVIYDPVKRTAGGRGRVGDYILQCDTGTRVIGRALATHFRAREAEERLDALFSIKAQVSPTGIHLFKDQILDGTKLEALLVELRAFQLFCQE